MRGRSWIVIFIIFLAIAVFGLLNEEVKGNVALIKVEGVITTNQNGLSGTSSESVMNLIDKAVLEGKKGLIIEINSPGGSAVASQEIGDKIKSLDIPVVSYIRDAGASGGYWIASATDYVFASPLSIVGSVGVTAAQLEFAGLLSKYNVTYRQLTAGKYKDIGTPFRKLTDDENKRILTKLDQMQDYFLNEVQVNRNLNESVMEELKLADFYTGMQAKDLNLIDEFGGKEDAIEYLKKQIGEVEVEVYEADFSILDVFGSMKQELILSFLPTFK